MARHDSPRVVEGYPDVQVNVADVRRRRVRVAAIVAGGTLVALACSHVIGRLWWNDVVFALNGWYVPYDLDVFLRAGHDVLAGHSPYPSPDTFAGDQNYVYPPFLALAMAPFAALPERHAVTLFMLLAIAALLVAIRLLGVRDRRCYVIAFFFPVTQESLKHGALGTFLVLVVALVWRYREQPYRAGAAAGLGVVLKLFLWPVVLWLWFTGRVRAAGFGVVAAAGLALASWAVIGFAGFADYPTLLRKLSDLESDSSFSLVAYGRLIDLPEWGAQALTLAVGGALLALALHAARDPQASRSERDRRSLTLVLAAALALTPIVWLHYLVLLVVPIALARPRFSPLWLVPLATWPLHWLEWFRGWPDGDPAALLATLALVAIVLIGSLREPRHLPRRIEAAARA